MKFVAWGEKITPARREITLNLSALLFQTYRQERIHTSFRQVKFLLKKIRHESKEGDEAA